MPHAYKLVTGTCDNLYYTKVYGFDMAAQLDKSARVAIVGGGAWGLSSALHLVEAGYTNVAVFERASAIPSPFSAANDLNKIVRAEYDDPFYTNLTLVRCPLFPAILTIQEAIQGWKTPLFGPYYHQTGYINCVSGKAPQKAVDTLTRHLASVQSIPSFAGETHRISGRDIPKYAWQLSGPMAGFRGYYNRLAGYAHSADALAGIHAHCEAHGVRFHLGERGTVKSLVYAAGGACTGLRTADGTTHDAELVICALGANAASLVPQVGDFAVARCWPVTHIQLTPREADLLRGIPVINVRDLGFFFEPDPVTRLFKLCPLGAGYSAPLPPGDVSDAAWGGFVPRDDEVKLRALLRETLPWLADRPFVESKFCWFADTPDSEYCVDYVPGTQRSVVVLSGDSGHGFKMMPIVGKWVVRLLRRGQEDQRWRWPTQRKEEDASWRVGTSRGINEVIQEYRARL